MNLPEYREALRVAQMRFHDACVDAANTLEKDLAAADHEFFEDQDRAENINAAAKRMRAE